MDAASSTRVEDPLLAGSVVGNLMKWRQAQHVVGDIKHYVDMIRRRGVSL